MKLTTPPCATEVGPVSVVATSAIGVMTCVTLAVGLLVLVWLVADTAATAVNGVAEGVAGAVKLMVKLRVVPPCASVVEPPVNVTDPAPELYVAPVAPVPVKVTLVSPVGRPVTVRVTPVAVVEPAPVLVTPTVSVRAVPAFTGLAELVMVVPKKGLKLAAMEVVTALVLLAVAPFSSLVVEVVLVVVMEAPEAGVVKLKLNEAVPPLAWVVSVG